MFINELTTCECATLSVIIFLGDKTKNKFLKILLKIFAKKVFYDIVLAY